MNECMYMPLGWNIGLIILIGVGCYFYGLRDGLNSRPPVHKGTYDSGEHEDRVDEYGEWH